MSGKNINFVDKIIRKSDFHKSKKALQIDDVDVNKFLVSKKESYDTKMYLNTLLDIMINVLLDRYA